MATPSGLPKVAGLDKVFGNADDQINQPPADKDYPKASVQDVTAQQQVTAPLEDGQAQTMTDDEILAQFKSTKDLLKSYKEIQGFTTRVSQENKAKDKVIAELQENYNKLKEEMEIRKFQAPVAAQQQSRSFNDLFIENPEQAFELKAMQVANTQRIAEVLEDEESKDRKKFPERLAYVKMLAQNPEYQQLTYSPRGVRKLFELADTSRKESMERNAHEILTNLVGGDLDIEKFKALVRKDQQPNTQSTTANPIINAYMPNTRTSTRTGADIDNQTNDLEREKQEAVKTGDASKVAGVLLKQALLK